MEVKVHYYSLHGGKEWGEEYDLCKGHIEYVVSELIDKGYNLDSDKAEFIIHPFDDMPKQIYHVHKYAYQMTNDNKMLLHVFVSREL